MDAPPLVRDSLNEIILQHLKCEGVSEELRQSLKGELSKGSSCFFEESDLFRIYRYASQCFLTVQINMFTGRVCKLDIQSTTTVGEIKCLIQAETTIPAFELKLIFKDKIMENHQPITMYKVTPCDNALTAVHVNAELVLSGDLGGSLDLWDYETGERQQTFEGHDNAISAISADRHRQRVLSGSNDDTLKLWDLSNGRCLKTFEGHDDCINTIQVDWEGMRAVSGSGDRTLRLWDLKEGKCTGTLSGDGSMLSVIVNWGKMQAVSGSMDKTMRLWDLKVGFSKDDSKKTSGEVTRDRPPGGGDRGEDQNWDEGWHEPEPEGLNRGLLRKFEGHTGGVRSVAASWEHMRVVTGSSDQTLRFWDLSDGRCLRTLQGHSGRVTAVSANFNDSRCVSGATDNTIRIWNLLNGECTNTMFGHTRWISSVVVDWGGKRVVSGSSDGKVKLWNLDSGECVQTYYNQDSQQAVLSIEHLPNTKYMIAYADAAELSREPEKKKLRRMEDNTHLYI